MQHDYHDDLPFVFERRTFTKTHKIFKNDGISEPIPSSHERPNNQSKARGKPKHRKKPRSWKTLAKKDNTEGKLEQVFKDQPICAYYAYKLRNNILHYLRRFDIFPNLYRKIADCNYFSRCESPSCPVCCKKQDLEIQRRILRYYKSTKSADKIHKVTMATITLGTVVARDSDLVDANRGLYDRMAMLKQLITGPIYARRKKLPPFAGSFDVRIAAYPTDPRKAGIVNCTAHIHLVFTNISRERTRKIAVWLAKKLEVHPNGEAGQKKWGRIIHISGYPGQSHDSNLLRRKLTYANNPKLRKYNKYVIDEKPVTQKVRGTPEMKLARYSYMSGFKLQELNICFVPPSQ